MWKMVNGSRWTNGLEDVKHRVSEIGNLMCWFFNFDICELCLAPHGRDLYKIQITRQILQMLVEGKYLLMEHIDFQQEDILWFIDNIIGNIILGNIFLGGSRPPDPPGFEHRGLG